MYQEEILKLVYSTEACIVLLRERKNGQPSKNPGNTKLMLNYMDILWFFSRGVGSRTAGAHQNFRKQMNALYTNKNLQWELEEFSFLVSVLIARVGRD